jgi:hypothetical protein
MIDPHDIARQLREIADAVERLDHAGDWVDDDGELLPTNEAAEIAAVSPETIRRWCSDSPHRIGRLFAGSLWLVSRTRLPQLITRRFGRPAMLEARSRAEKMRQSRSPPQQPAETTVRATA